MFYIEINERENWIIFYDGATELGLYYVFNEPLEGVCRILELMV